MLLWRPVHKDLCFSIDLSTLATKSPKSWTLLRLIQTVVRADVRNSKKAGSKLQLHLVTWYPSFDSGFLSRPSNSHIKHLSCTVGARWRFRCGITFIFLSHERHRRRKNEHIAFRNKTSENLRLHPEVWQVRPRPMMELLQSQTFFLGDSWGGFFRKALVQLWHTFFFIVIVKEVVT